MTLKEDTYTLGVCPMYRDEKWMSVDESLIHLEESGGWVRYA